MYNLNEGSTKDISAKTDVGIDKFKEIEQQKQIEQQIRQRTIERLQKEREQLQKQREQQQEERNKQYEELKKKYEEHSKQHEEFMKKYEEGVARDRAEADRSTLIIRIEVVVIVLGFLICCILVAKSALNSPQIDSSTETCPICDREFREDSENARSIMWTGMCSNCYSNYKAISDALKELPVD